MASIQSKMAAGAAWTLLFRMSAGGIGLLSTAILARLLTPADFGIVALAMAFVGALELMRSFGFDVALIQDQHAGREKYDTAWTINMLVSVGVAAILFASAWPIAAFYEEPRLVPVVLVLAAAVAVEGFENVGVVEFRKDLQFNKDFVFMFGKKASGFLLTIPLAFLLRSYWALVVGILATRAMGIGLSYYLHSYRPRFSLACWRELFGFSAWLFLNNLLFFLQERAANFFIGKSVGASGVGLYTLSYEVAHIPTTELVAPINRAVFPGYAKMAADLRDLKENYLQVMSLIGLFAIPAAFGLAAVADMAVLVLLGPKWVDAIILVEILAFASLISTLESNIGTVYLALGKPRMLTLVYGFYVAVLLVMLTVLVPSDGVRGAAIAFLIAACTTLPVHFIVMYRILTVRVTEFIGRIWRPAIAASVMYAALLYLKSNHLVPAADNTFPAIHLIVAVSLGAVVYLVTELLLWMLSGRGQGAERIVLDKVRSLRR